MTKKAIITWISVVSGIITILLVFNNPFKDQARLVAYAENQEILNIEKKIDNSEKIDTTYAVKLLVQNDGELVAKDVHIKVGGASGAAFIRKNGNYKKVEDSQSIYIDRLEPGTEVELYYWGSFLFLHAFNIDDSIAISSPDSGKADIRTDIDGSKLIWFVEKYFVLLVAGIVLVPLWILIIFGNNSTEQQDEPEEPKSDLKRELELLNYAWSIDLLTEEEFQSKGKELVNRAIEDKVG
ncbi:hypothetical protein [Vibrio lentus]|uniref:hypothetical protein n=1 Tax=Vibrio lentus TaxID=136468 RepID=UPI000C81CEBF|nr:hypothetical protein [Vibrio lentus]PML07978.1 hypothetical protein BCT85_20010 [Vibrio lentus]